MDESMNMDKIHVPIYPGIYENPYKYLTNLEGENPNERIR
jgi:hypothetical protein